MPLSLIVGPPNSGRVSEVVRRLRADLDRDPVLVVPTADDAARFERMLCEEGVPVLGASITTFAWFLEDLAATFGVKLPPMLSRPQRLALVRAATGAVPLRLLRRSAARPGFVAALDALLAELGAALVEPDELALAASTLEEGDYEAELAAIYRSYAALRERAGRSDAASVAIAVLSALRRETSAWGARPVFVYGFDDLTRSQREVLDGLAQTTEVTVSVTYDDRVALAARATMLAELRDELGGDEVLRLEHDGGHSESALLGHLDRHLFEPNAERQVPDDGLALLECAGGRGEAEAIGVEIARLLAGGEAQPDEIAVVLRRPAGGGPLLGHVLRRLGIPVAVEADVPLARTVVGRSLIALCDAASPHGAPGDLLAHMRSDPAFPAHMADGLERRIARGQVRTVDEAFESWDSPPRHLARLRSARGPSSRLRALAAIAREVAEAAHDRAAPVAGETGTGVPLVPVELRAGGVAAELLEELAAAGELDGCEPADLAEAIEAIESASVRLWRGSTEGRVRILDPYRARVQPARYLFCASLREGEFPSGAPTEPLLSEERRASLGIPALRRRDQAEEERYLFHACVSRPTRRLYLSWRSSDDDGRPLARSPFVDDVLDLVALGDAGEDPLTTSRGLERSVLAPAEAPTARELARGLAARGRDADHAGALAALGVPDDRAGEVLELLARVPDPEALPGPLAVPELLAELEQRQLTSASSLESWLECPYRWFVDHELRPERLEPTADPMWVGGIVHAALKRLYADPPGTDGIPRGNDVGRWKRRFADLLAEEVESGGGDAGRSERATAIARARAQVDAFLEAEAGSETALRPRADLLERRFGFDDEDDPGALDLGEGLALRGSIDRIDVAPDGIGAVVRDYKAGKTVPSAEKFAERGVLQAPLYMLAARHLLELEPIGGLYQPLGGTESRKPRGIALRDEPRLEGLDVSARDLVEPDELDAELERVREQARLLGGEMRRGEIDRRPLGGRCPTWCTYQPICRLERALGPTAGNGENGG